MAQLLIDKMAISPTMNMRTERTMNQTSKLTLKTGDKAYFDSFAGLIACEVVKIEGETGPASTGQKVTLQVKAVSSPNYKRGETIETNGLHAVPREAIHQRDYMSRIKLYDVEADS